jgi:hypothetical protein
MISIILIGLGWIILVGIICTAAYSLGYHGGISAAAEKRRRDYEEDLE